MTYSTYNYQTWLSEEDLQRCWAVVNNEIPQSEVSIHELEEFQNLIEHIIENRTIH